MDTMQGENKTVDDCPFKYPNSPASLRQFALTSLAFDLYVYGHAVLKEKLNYKSALGMTLPRHLENAIHKRVAEVDKTMKALKRHFRDLWKVGWYRGGISLSEIYSEGVCYGPDGDISFERTAKKLLSSDKLSAEDKYVIACVYCFEDDIRGIWPTVQNFSAIFKNYFPFEIPEVLITYWTARMNGSQRRFPINQFITTSRKFNQHFWAAFKFILNEGRTVQNNFIDYALERSGYINAKNVLPKLSSEQLKFVWRHHSAGIIVNFSSNPEDADFVWKVWEMAKEFIDDVKFCHILDGMCLRLYKCVSQSVCNDLVQIRITLQEIWITAPDSLKRKFINSNHVVKILNNLESWDEKRKAECYDHNMGFFLQLFRDMPFEMRNCLWLRYWHVFVIRYRAKFLNTFLNLCLKEEDISRFGETMMLDYDKMGSFLNFLFEKEGQDGVIDYFKASEASDDVIGCVLKKIIFTEKAWLLDPEFDKFAELSKFIKSCFCGTEEMIEFKSLVYFSVPFHSLLISRLSCGVTNDLIRITELFVSSEADVIRAKRDLLEYWRRYYLTSDLINFNRCERFLIWCLGHSNNLSSRNCDFPVDEVFEILLLDAVSKLSFLLGSTEMRRSEPEPFSNRKLDEFAILDEFLTCHFVTSEAINKYKIDQIMRKDIPTISEILGMRNESVLNDCLIWFFDGDLGQVKKFKSDIKKL